MINLKTRYRLIRRGLRGAVFYCVDTQTGKRFSLRTLTGRELDVLKLLARGKSNKEIGTNLYVSETTVKSHLRSIFTKLNVLSRTAAITEANRRGLVQL